MSGLWAIDSFEDGGWAVLERDGGSALRLPRSWLPIGAEEGSVLRVTLVSEDGERDGPHVVHLRILLDRDEEQRRRERVDELRERLPRGPEGDIEL